MSTTSTNTRDELPIVKHYGSAKSGTKHAWLTKITGLALVPLGIWFVFTLIGMDDIDAGFVETRATLQRPLVAIMMLFFTLTLLWHSKLEMTNIVQDYVQCRVKRLWTMVFLKGLTYFLMAVAIVSIVRLIAVA